MSGLARTEATEPSRRTRADYDPCLWAPVGRQYALVPRSLVPSLKAHAFIKRFSTSQRYASIWSVVRGRSMSRSIAVAYRATVKRLLAGFVEECLEMGVEPSEW